jgi:hypothetical protein
MRTGGFIEGAPDGRGTAVTLKVAECCERMAKLLAFALALESDVLLQSTIRGLVAREECALMLGEAGPSLRVANGKPLDHGSLAGEVPPSLATFDLPEKLRGSPELAAFVNARLSVSGARSEALRLLRGLQGGAHRLAASDFRKLAGWAPILAAEAYLHTALTQMLLDETREGVRREPTESAVRSRWGAMHALSHSSLLAASAEPTGWLAKMADSFEWQTWTPSFPLVRERVLRLAVRGAWIAARFGTTMVERYLRFIVEARHLLQNFDAVLGTMAIALAFPSERASIAHGMRRALTRRLERAVAENEQLVIQACIRSVSLVFDNFELAEELTLQRGRLRAAALGARHVEEDRRLSLFLALDDDIDGADIDEHGLLPALLAMPSVASASADVFFASSPAELRTTRDWSLERVRAVLERSGAVRLCSCGSGKPVEGCCAN